MNVALVLSGGTGNRLGGEIPKQYIEVQGRPIIAYCLETIGRLDQVGAIQIVAEERWKDRIFESMTEEARRKLRGFSAPGQTRQLSVVNGMRDILSYAPREAVVLIHDAARPLVSAEQIEACLTACMEREGVIPVLPMKDTVYLGDGKRITSLLERSSVFAGQAPEAFLLGRYYEANEQLLPERIMQINGSTEPAILAGMDIAMIPGDEGNFKITTKADLERFQAIMG